MLAGLLPSSGMSLVARQYWLGGKRVDLVARHGEELVGIEVKLTDWRRAIGQAQLNAAYFDRTYIALPANPRRRVDLALLDRLQVGLLEFTDERIEIVVESPKRTLDIAVRNGIALRLGP